MASMSITKAGFGEGRQLSVERNGDLAFGLYGVPAAITRPITDQLHGRSFRRLPMPEAAKVLEGVALLQWPKAAVVGGLGLGPSIGAHQLPTRLVAPALGAVTGLMMILPCYMILISILWLIMKRRARRSTDVVAEHAWITIALRSAPLVAVLLAAVIGVQAAS
jgi:hypothetical protein